MWSAWGAECVGRDLRQDAPRDEQKRESGKAVWEVARGLRGKACRRLGVWRQAQCWESLWGLSCMPLQRLAWSFPWPAATVRAAGRRVSCCRAPLRS